MTALETLIALEESATVGAGASRPGHVRRLGGSLGSMTFTEARRIMEQTGRVSREAWGHEKPSWIAMKRAEEGGGFFGPDDGEGHVVAQELDQEDIDATDWYELRP